MRMHPILMSAVTIIFTASLAVADPIVITGGVVVVGSFASPSLPPFGFQLLGDNTNIGGITFAQGGGFVTVGQVINLSDTIALTWSPFSGPSGQTVNGARFEDTGVRGTLNFNAAAVRVPNNPSGISVPFTMTGEVSFFQQLPFEPPGPVLFTTALRGAGTASTGFFGGDGGIFRVSGTVFSFSPAPTATPEPGTVGLLGTGFVLLAGRLRRRRR